LRGIARVTDPAHHAARPTSRAAHPPKEHTALDERSELESAEAMTDLLVALERGVLSGGQQALLAPPRRGGARTAISSDF
jgi:hypothetical protein